MKVDPPPPALRPVEVAARLGIHYNTVRRIPASDLPYFRIGTRGDRRYRPEDVDAYIRERMIGRA